MSTVIDKIEVIQKLDRLSCWVQEIKDVATEQDSWELETIPITRSNGMAGDPDASEYYDGEEIIGGEYFGEQFKILLKPDIEIAGSMSVGEGKTGIMMYGIKVRCSMIHEYLNKWFNDWAGNVVGDNDDGFPVMYNITVARHDGAFHITVDIAPDDAICL